MYLLFKYLAVILFVPIGLLLAISFVRAGDNAQKAEFKESHPCSNNIYLAGLYAGNIRAIILVNSLFVSVFYSILQGIGDTDRL